ncbi:hypothetical protein C2E23DRAFT_837044 [Lenzites betulinus]|nr:hypothetical protein C2E23DRAFT_837044 [Lenzites betulinus]
MSSVALRVELPSYAHSFEVNVPPEATILDVKQEIERVCPGSPATDCQRLVSKGRFLNDEEKVDDVWKSPDDSRVVHLAVNPSGWASAPPNFSHIVQAAQARSSTIPRATQSRLSSHGPRATHPGPAPSPVPSYYSVAYIQYLHNIALGTLSGGAITTPQQPAAHELETWRAAAREVYRHRGWVWPAVYDEPFPSGSTEEGAKYEPVTLEGLPYLSLTTPNATPTPAQAHALKVFSHTFSLLSMANDPMLYVPSAPHPAYPNTPTTNLNQRLQDLGLPPLYLIPDQNVPRNGNDVAGAEIRAIPIRALLVPLLMLAFRTLLLIYFFSPSKRPLFGIMLSAWIMYEAWNAMRLVLNDGNERRGDAAGDPARPDAAGGPGAIRGRGRGGQAAARGNPSADRSLPEALFDRLTMLNLSAEDALLDTDAQAPPPGLLHKAKAFVALFCMTLHPATWDRRRAALRRREGRIRTEANAREAAMNARAERESAGADAPARTAEEEARAAAQAQVVARHERRPEWVKAYVQRVQFSEWVDDP